MSDPAASAGENAAYYRMVPHGEHTHGGRDTFYGTVITAAHAQSLSDWHKKSRQSVSATVYKYWLELCGIVLAPVFLVLPAFFVPIDSTCDRGLGFVVNTGLFGFLLGAYLVLMFELVCNLKLSSELLILVLTPVCLVLAGVLINNAVPQYAIVWRNVAMAASVIPVFIVPMHHIYQETHLSDPSHRPECSVPLLSAPQSPVQEEAEGAQAKKEAGHTHIRPPLHLKSVAVGIQFASRLRHKVLLRRLKRFGLACCSMGFLGGSLVFLTIFTQYFIRYGDHSLGTALLLLVFYSGHGLLAIGGTSLAEAADRELPEGSTHQDCFREGRAKFSICNRTEVCFAYYLAVFRINLFTSVQSWGHFALFQAFGCVFKLVSCLPRMSASWRYRIMQLKLPGGMNAGTLLLGDTLQQDRHGICFTIFVSGVAEAVAFLYFVSTSLVMRYGPNHAFWMRDSSDIGGGGTGSGGGSNSTSSNTTISADGYGEGYVREVVLLSQAEFDRMLLLVICTALADAVQRGILLLASERCFHIYTDQVARNIFHSDKQIWVVFVVVPALAAMTLALVRYMAHAESLCAAEILRVVVQGNHNTTVPF
jgi:hypothetical protein